MNTNRPIAVFDSGLGGLTALSEIRTLMPCEDILYYADTKNVPYGDKSLDEIHKLAMDIVDYMVRRNAKCIAFGCNISSAVALEDARKKYPEVPMMGLISPEMASAAREGSGGRIGVIATTATVTCGKYPLVIKSASSSVEVFMCACPGFVPLVESGRLTGADVDAVVESSLGMLVSAKIDTMIYGCTHYPLLGEPIRAFFQKNQMSPRIINPAIYLAANAKAQLKKQHLVTDRIGTGIVRFVVSAQKHLFKQNMKKMRVPYHESMVFNPGEVDEELAPIR